MGVKGARVHTLEETGKQASVTSSRQPLGRLQQRRIQQIGEHVLPAAEQKDAERAAQLIPELHAAGELFRPQPVVIPVGQLQDLVDVKGQQVQDEKHHGQVVVAVAEVVLDVIA